MRHCEECHYVLVQNLSSESPCALGQPALRVRPLFFGNQDPNVRALEECSPTGSQQFGDGRARIRDQIHSGSCMLRSRVLTHVSTDGSGS